MMTIPLLLVERHVVRSQWKAHGFCDVLTLLSDLFESFIDWCIKVLLSTLGAYPGWDVINVNRLAVELEPHTGLSVFHAALTKLTTVG